MSHWIVAPLALPALIAAFTLLGMRRRLVLGRTVSIAACLALLGVALRLATEASNGETLTYALGDWPAPFGIVLVLDRLSALMLVLVALLSLCVLLHVVATGLDRRGWHFHPLFHFQLLGLNGAFLTGDLFNLFVFFEVLLIASYGLMLHGQGAKRLQAGVQYVVINLVGSTLFLVAIGILYGVTGTLNMADMALRIADAPPGDQGLLRAGAQLLIAVFALKGALLPLHLWLPRTYANTSAPVGALFAIMTKVGIYSIIRVTGTAFAPLDWNPTAWMLPAAMLTVLVGFVGLLAAARLREMAAFAIVGSTGTLLIAVTLFQQDGLAAALYYLPHTTLAGAALFLVTDLICRRRPDLDDRLELGPRYPGIELLSALFLLTAIAIVGLPPLSGFVGKLLILDAARDHGMAVWAWAAILLTTLLGLLGFARAGSILFWKSATWTAPARAAPTGLTRASMLPAGVLLLSLALLTVFAGPATLYAEAAAAQAGTADAYVRAVMEDAP